MPGPSGSAYTGGRETGGLISVTYPNVGSFLGRIKMRKAGLAFASDQIAERLAQSIAETAKDLVAKDEHKVEESIRVEHREPGPVYTVVADRGGERDETAVYLEIGTIRMAARPYMKPSLDLVLSAGGIHAALVKTGGLLPPMRGV